MRQLRAVNKILSVVAIALASFAIVLAIKWDAAKKDSREQRVFIDSLFAKYELIRTRSSQSSGLLRALSDSNIRHIRLSGMPVAPNSEAFIYWNTANGQVYVNPVDLPELGANEYYQLWAFQGDSSFNLGLLNMAKEPYQIQRMRDVASANEFAINVVENGEKARPLLENVVVASSR